MLKNELDEIEKCICDGCSIVEVAEKYCEAEDCISLGVVLNTAQEILHEALERLWVL